MKVVRRHTTHGILNVDFKSGMKHSDV